MTQQPKDFNWLKDQLISLLESAMSAEVRDHQACAKYADLLFKMLPRKVEKTSNDLIEQIRQAVVREKRGATGQGEPGRTGHRVEKAKDPDDQPGHAPGD